MLQITSRSDEETIAFGRTLADALQPPQIAILTGPLGAGKTTLVKGIAEAFDAARQEDVRVIGLSILSGAHNAIVPRVMELLREKEMADVKVVVGGIIPDEDARELERQGVTRVFQPGASLDTIVSCVREAAGLASR